MFSTADFLTLVGLLAFLGIVYHWIKTIFGHLLAQSLGLGYPWNKARGWAVITGATDGIGKAFAFELAAKGFNIVLIGRDRQRLANVQTRIAKKHRVEINVIQADFTDEDCYERIERMLRELRVTLLVNNVGMGYTYPEYLHMVPNGSTALLGILRCNLLPVTMMSRICIPRMKHYRIGLIINIASASALLPTPLVAVYSATKAYVDFLSRALNAEYAEYGLTIQSVLPFTVQTKMTGDPELDLFTPNPTTFVRATLKTAGFLTRTHGYLPHALQGWYYTVLPEWISARLQQNFFLNLRTTLKAKLKEEE